MCALVSCGIRGDLWSILYPCGGCSPLQALKSSEELVAALGRQIGAVSYSQAAVVTGNTNNPNTCWRDSSAGNK